MWWLATLALGQTVTGLEEGDWRDCQNHSPIAGTAGFENARAANETNALAYGATGYLQHVVLPQLNDARARAKADGEKGWHGSGGYRFRHTAKAAVVPTYEVSSGCPADLRISERPLDLGSVNLGIAASNGTIGLFYTSSIVYGYTPSWDPRERFLYGMTGYVYGSVGAVLAPLAGSDQAFGEGVSAVQTDFVVGGIADLPGVHARVGWVGSQGLYADVEADVPVFVTAMIDEPSLSNLFQGGVRRLKTSAGATSLYAKNQPVRPLPVLNPGGSGFAGDSTGGFNFTTGHVVQENLSQVFDVQAAVAVAPRPLLHEAQVGLHSKVDEDGKAKGVDYLVRGGVVQLPDMWFYGVQGGLRPTFRAEVGLAISEDQGAASVRYLVMMNDPEQLLLFPFAYNAVTMGATIDGRF